MCLEHSDASENQSVWNMGEISLPIMGHHMHLRWSKSLLSEAFSSDFHSCFIIQALEKNSPAYFIKTWSLTSESKTRPDTFLLIHAWWHSSVLPPKPVVAQMFIVTEKQLIFLFLGFWHPVLCICVFQRFKGVFARNQPASQGVVHVYSARMNLLHTQSKPFIPNKSFPYTTGK